MSSPPAGAKWPWYLPLLIPFVATLWVPFYNSLEPNLAGIPFFYWYQFLWVILSVIITGGVYFATREPEVVSPQDRGPLNEDLA